MTQVLPTTKPRTRIPATEKEARSIDLICEIRELFTQWTIEVPKKRKPWPESSGSLGPAQLQE